MQARHMYVCTYLGNTYSHDGMCVSQCQQRRAAGRAAGLLGLTSPLRELGIRRSGAFWVLWRCHVVVFMVRLNVSVLGARSGPFDHPSCFAWVSHKCADLGRHSSLTNTHFSSTLGVVVHRTHWHMRLRRWATS